jgi:hypothetical protein
MIPDIISDSKKEKNGQKYQGLFTNIIGDDKKINKNYIESLIDCLNDTLKNNAKTIKTNFINNVFKDKIPENIEIVLKVTGSLWLIIFVAESYRELTSKIQRASYRHIKTIETNKQFVEDKH